MFHNLDLHIKPFFIKIVSDEVGMLKILNKKRDLETKTRNISYQLELLKVPSDQPDNLHKRLFSILNACATSYFQFNPKHTPLRL